MSGIPDELRELDQLWTQGEIEGNVSLLEALATDDFTLVGPAGFVLDKQQWLDRYRNDDLRTRLLSLDDTASRSYRDAAVTVARQVQEAEYRGAAANGEFRTTRIAVRDGSGWRLGGLHLSPIAAARPAPGAGRAR